MLSGGGAMRARPAEVPLPLSQSPICVSIYALTLYRPPLFTARARQNQTAEDWLPAGSSRPVAMSGRRVGLRTAALSGRWSLRHGAHPPFAPPCPQAL